MGSPLSFQLTASAFGAHVDPIGPDLKSLDQTRNHRTTPDSIGTVQNGADATATPSDLAAMEDLELPEPPRLTPRDIATESLMIDVPLARADGELTTVVQAQLNQLAEMLTRKTGGVVAYVRGLCADAEVILTLEKRLAVRRKALNNRVERFEQFVKVQMIRMDRRSLAGEFSKLDVVLNPPRLKILDATLIPDLFIRREVVPETTVVTILDDEIKATLVAREKALAAREKVVASAAKKQLPTPMFSDADLPAEVPGAALERGTRLRIG